MAISAQCPHCYINLNLRDEMAGRMVRCRCGKPLRVPEPSSSGSALEDLLSEELSRPYEAPPPREAPRHQLPSSQPSRSAAANPYGSPPPARRSRERRDSPYFIWLLFSFEGRIPRRWLWAINFPMNLVSYLIFFTMLPPPGERPQPAGDPSALVLTGIFMIVFGVLTTWISLALVAKRWHDRDKSAWCILIQLIPLIGPLWTFVELGCLRGTYGPNEYGDDPT